MNQNDNNQNEFVSFRVEQQEFCIDIQAVREIRGWTPASPIPRSPNYVCGVINLRGAIIPVIDLRQRLGFGKTEPSARHVIVVTELESRVTGVLVDGVSGIVSASASEIQPTPSVASQLARDFVSGVLALEGRMINVLSLSTIAARSGVLAA